MSRNNDVFQILVGKTQDTILAAGNYPKDLLPGQVGIFDAKTNVSLDETATPTEFYIGVGIDSDGDGVTDNIAKSAGQYIQTAGVVDLSVRSYNQAVPAIIEIAGYEAVCNTDYALRVEYRNEEIYKRQGTVGFTKTYAFTIESNCPDCVCDNNEITIALVNAVNADVENGYGIAYAITKDALNNGVLTDLSKSYAVGDVISLEDVAVVAAYNEANDTTFETAVRIQSLPLTKKDFSSIKMEYYYLRSTAIIASKAVGFGAETTVTTIQVPVNEGGSGYDVKQKEYIAGGWNGNPGAYRQSAVTGLAKEILYQADFATQYCIFSLTYDQKSLSGWGEYENNLATIICIPMTLTTAIANLKTVLGGILGITVTEEGLPEADAGTAGAVTTAANADFTVSDAKSGVATGKTAISTTWELVSQPATADVKITNGDTLTPTFGFFTVDGTYTFKLTVVDSDGFSSTDTVDVVATT